MRANKKLGGDDSKRAVIGSSSCCFVGTYALEGSIFGPCLLPSLCLFLVHLVTPLARTNGLSCIIGTVLCSAFLFCGFPSILLSAALLPFPPLGREANLPLSGHVWEGGERTEWACRGSLWTCRRTFQLPVQNVSNARVAAEVYHCITCRPGSEATEKWCECLQACVFIHSCATRGLPQNLV